MLDRPVNNILATSLRGFCYLVDHSENAALIRSCKIISDSYTDQPGNIIESVSLLER